VPGRTREVSGRGKSQANFSNKRGVLGLEAAPRARKTENAKTAGVLNKEDCTDIGGVRQHLGNNESKDSATVAAG